MKSKTMKPKSNYHSIKKKKGVANGEYHTDTFCRAFMYSIFVTLGERKNKRKDTNIVVIQG